MEEKITVELEVTCRMRYITRLDLTKEQFEKISADISGFGVAAREAGEKLAETYIDWRDDWADTDNIEVEVFDVVDELTNDEVQQRHDQA